ncbi:MAG: LytTR family DNA-binding domain-containing protein [Bacteroidota bacterium]
MINCIALDDEPMALEVIKSFCKRIPFLDLAQTYTSVSATRKHLRKHPVNLIFLDIQMPDMNGIAFYKTISQDTMVIFTTAFTEYAVEGFNVDAVDYLLKPIEFDRFQTACEKAKDYLDYLRSSSPHKHRHLYVRSEYALVKISFSEILYLETMDDYIRIHREGKESVLTLMSMKKMIEKLPKDDFIRVHRSYIVPMKRIEYLRGRTISVGSVTIPLGTRYEKEFIDRYKGLI